MINQNKYQSKKQKNIKILDADPKAIIQYINFPGNIDCTGNTIFFIHQEAKQTGFSKENFECVIYTQ